MIQKLFILLVVGLSVSCTTKQPADTGLSQDEQRIRAVIFSVDSKIWGDYGRANKADYTMFTQTEYNNRLSNLNAPRAQEMKKLLPSFSTKEITAHPGTFVFCGYSPVLKIAFCDDAACQGVEFFERQTSSRIIEQWNRMLPKIQCVAEKTGN